jgi:hypothetical protein
MIILADAGFDRLTFTAGNVFQNGMALLPGLAASPE